MFQDTSRISHSITLWCALGLGSISLPAAEKGSPTPTSGTHSQPHNADLIPSDQKQPSPEEIRAIIDGLDSDAHGTRSRVRRIIDANAKELLPALLRETSLGRGSVEVRLSLHEIARSRNLIIPLPERLSLENVRWALRNLNTEEGRLRIAVAEVLRGNPLIYAEPEILATLKENREGKIFVTFMEKQTKERPQETIEFLRQLPESELAVFLGGKSGPALLTESVRNTLTTFADKSFYLSESQRVLLLGGRDSNLHSFISSLVESSSTRRDINEILETVAKAGRAGSCAERLATLGIQYSKEGFVLMQHSTSGDDSQRATVARIIDGISNHYKELCPSHKPIDQLDLSEEPSPIISSTYGDAGGLWNLAVNEATYSEWLAHKEFNSHVLVHPAAFDAPALSQREFLVRCWQAAAVTAVSPDGARPTCSLLASVLPQALKNIADHPPQSYDSWKLEYLSNWVEVLTTLHEQNLPPELFPSGLVADSLPPHHVPGRGTPLGVLQTYSHITRVVNYQAGLHPQSVRVLKRVLDKLSTYDYDWLDEGPRQATRLILSLEETAQRIAANGGTDDEVTTELERIVKERLTEVMTPVKPAETASEQQTAPPPSDSKPIQSLEDVLKFLDTPMRP